MEALKSLIIGWSIAWGATLIAIPEIRLEGVPVIALRIFEKSSAVKIPIYVFSVWAAGCILILAVYWFINMYKK